MLFVIWLSSEAAVDVELTIRARAFVSLLRTCITTPYVCMYVLASVCRAAAAADHHHTPYDLVNHKLVINHVLVYGIVPI